MNIGNIAHKLWIMEDTEIKTFMFVVFNRITLIHANLIIMAAIVLFFCLHFIMIVIGIIFCHVKIIVKLTQLILLLNFIIQVLNGNTPILIKIEITTRRNVVLFACSHDQFSLKIVTIMRIEGRVWNTKKVIFFSFFVSIDKNKIKPTVLSSNNIHIITHCLDDRVMIEQVIINAKGIMRGVLIFIKKISLSMNYEPISFFSLSYYFHTNKIVNFILVCFLW